MSQELATQGELYFEVDTGLISELGERLVARPSIALAELIKNAYDADATQVTVLLQDVTTHNGTIIVEDNGVGMTFEAIRDKWMRIATTDKLENPISSMYGRSRTGAKGIGRFAVGRLANKLSVYSVAQREDGTKEGVNVWFDWRRDFQPGRNLQEVSVHFDRKSVRQEEKTGVTLLVENLKDLWNEEEISAIRRDLLGLVNPFGYSPILTSDIDASQKLDPGFSVILEVPEFPEYEGELSEYVMSGAWSTLTGDIDEKGIARYTIEIHHTGETKTYTLSGHEQDFRQLVGASFTVHHFVYESGKFEEIEFGVREAIRYARKHAGVRIYLDGFRVFGYGEPGNDWLGLDELRAQRVRMPLDAAQDIRLEAQTYSVSPFLRLPGNNQLFGAVKLSQSHHSEGKHDIEINIARDRLVENEAFDQLRTFVTNGIYWLTLQYARVEYAERRKTVEIEEQKRVEPLTPKLDRVLQPVERVLRHSNKLTTLEKEEIEDQLTELREQTKQIDLAAQRLEDQRINEISMLRVLASVGTLVSFLNHQLRAIVDNLGQIVTLFELYTDKVDESIRNNFLINVGDLRRWRSFVVQQVDLLSFLLGKQSRAEQQIYNIHKIVDDVAKSLEGYQSDYGIQFNNLIPINLMSPPMFLAELHAIVINVFTNALKAVRGRDDRRIEARGGTRRNRIYIQLLDTGRGLDIPPDKAFLPFETTSLPDNILGEGTGLGLYIVQALAGNYNGAAQFIDAPAPWRTCIEIEFPTK